MAKVVFVDHEGTERSIDVNDGETIMEAAIKNSIPGIDADCGGACACATCHVYVEDQFLGQIGEAQDMEQSMLDFAENVQANSRLCCQIFMSGELDGIRIVTPESQH
ncbi:MAG: 2Fe-2S iron-sulfur cluster-binding protein [Pseudomonadota bacterium]